MRMTCEALIARFLEQEVVGAVVVCHEQVV